MRRFGLFLALVLSSGEALAHVGFGDEGPRGASPPVLITAIVVTLLVFYIAYMERRTGDRNNSRRREHNS